MTTFKTNYRKDRNVQNTLPFEINIKNAYLVDAAALG